MEGNSDTWLNSEDIMPSKMSQSQRDKYYGCQSLKCVLGVLGVLGD